MPPSPGRCCRQGEETGGKRFEQGVLKGQIRSQSDITGENGTSLDRVIGELRPWEAINARPVDGVSAILAHFSWEDKAGGLMHGGDGEGKVNLLVLRHSRQRETKRKRKRGSFYGDRDSLSARDSAVAPLEGPS